MKHYSKLKETKISSQTIFDGIVGVKFDTVRLVNGHKATRLYLNHQGASAVLPIEGDNVYLVQQFRYPVGRVTLELPAGKREKGQTYLTCARAELKQETGMCAKSLQKTSPRQSLQNGRKRRNLRRQNNHYAPMVEVTPQITLRLFKTRLYKGGFYHINEV